VGAITEFQAECWREAYRDLVPQGYVDRVSVEDREVCWRDRLVSGSRKIALAESGNAVVGVVSWGEDIARSTSSQASGKGDSSAADSRRLCESDKTKGQRHDSNDVWHQLSSVRQCPFNGHEDILRSV
jgi:hypothetical protein